MRFIKTMTLIDWASIAGIAVPIIVGAFYIGRLDGEVGQLEIQINNLQEENRYAEIRKKEDEAADRISKLAKKIIKKPTGFAHRYDWKQKEGPSQVKMIETKEGFCYFTRIVGSSNDVWIGILGNTWYLGGYSKQKHAEASARCWKWPEVSDSND